MCIYLIGWWLENKDQVIYLLILYDSVNPNLIFCTCICLKQGSTLRCLQLIMVWEWLFEMETSWRLKPLWLFFSSEKLEEMNSVQHWKISIPLFRGRCYLTLCYKYNYKYKKYNFRVNDYRICAAAICKGFFLLFADRHFLSPPQYHYEYIIIYYYTVYMKSL